MNYYPFHIGDYVSATRHLSWDEDAAYRRLLDVYYTTEKPLPADPKAVCRLVLAQSDAQRAAVQTILEEFFSATEAGWINARADTEIAAMREKVSAVEEKDEHEKTRKERYRERRAAFFATLRERGIVPAWDIPMKELQALAEKHGTAGTPAGTPSTETTGTTGTLLERDEDVTSDGTGTAIPTPTPTPTPKGVQGGKPPQPPDWIPADAWDEFVAMRKAKGKRTPFTVGAAKGIIAELDRLRVAGEDVAAVLRQSVRNGWSDVYPVKGESLAGKKPAMAGSDWTAGAH